MHASKINKANVDCNKQMKFVRHAQRFKRSKS